MAKNVLVTGSNGFVARNLVARLKMRDDVKVVVFHRDSAQDVLRDALLKCDTVFHLAAANRPTTPDGFKKDNSELTERIARMVDEIGTSPHIIFSSSVQATLDNPYGQSKKQAEEHLIALLRDTKARVSILRLKNVFGKWCKPNYNSVVATFCHNIANDLPIQISDVKRTVELVYVDDVCEELERISHWNEDLPGTAGRGIMDDSIPSTTIDLGNLADLIHSFREMRKSHVVPDLTTRFLKQLYATYVSYVDPMRMGYQLEKKTDARGSLAEFVKSNSFGQIFVSRTIPGITRGNHFHHTKSEKFLVLEGKAKIRMRHIEQNEVFEFCVEGREFSVVDIPPGYTHDICNVGDTELVTLFWSSEIFVPSQPDTYFLKVDQQGEQ